MGSSLFSMEWSGANGGRPGASLNSELPYAIQTPTRLAMIARWRWSPRNLKGSERLAGGRAQRYHRKARREYRILEGCRSCGHAFSGMKRLRPRTVVGILPFGVRG